MGSEAAVTVAVGRQQGVQPSDAAPGVSLAQWQTYDHGYLILRRAGPSRVEAARSGYRRPT